MHNELPPKDAHPEDQQEHIAFLQIKQRYLARLQLLNVNPSNEARLLRLVIRETDIAKNRLQLLQKACANAQKPLIVIYGNPDPDALGSAWALKEILRKWDKNATIIYTGEVGRLENEAMIKYLRIPAVKSTPDLLKEADLIAIVDCQPSFFRNEPLPRYDIVFDHHPIQQKEDATGNLAYTDIRPNCLATSSILTEYLRAAEINISRRLATALLYGIQTDARNLHKTTSNTDQTALNHLLRKADRDILHRIEFSSYSLNRLNYFSIALIKLRNAPNVLYSDIGPVPSADICAQIADFLIRVKEAQWALVSGIAGNKLVIVFRCDGQKKNAGETANAAFGLYGSAGGHSTMGRAEIEEQNLPSGLKLTQNEKIEGFILSSLAKVEKAFQKLHRIYLREEN